MGHLKSVRFCNTDERRHYKSLKKRIGHKDVTNSNMLHILQHMAKNRAPYDKVMSTWRIIWEFIFSDFFCWCNCCVHNLTKCWCPTCIKKGKPQQYRYNKLFMNGIKRFYSEIDIVKVLQAIRRSKLLLNALTHQKQRVMMSW